MIRLKRYEFTCPFCNEPRVTFITEQKENEIRAREKLIQEIFPSQFFDDSYRQIFISKICSGCQKDKFGSDSNEKPFDVFEDEPTDELESRISEMYENARE